MHHDNCTMKPADGSPLSVLEAIMPTCKARTLYESVTEIVQSIFMHPTECETTFNSTEKKITFTYTNYDGASQTVNVKYDFIGRHIVIKTIKFT
jgi:hypothetical protein